MAKSSAATIRLGKISSINYAEGKARVTYEDRDQAVTKELPFLAWQYQMPKISDLVVVACFSNGTVSGVILGPIFSTANTPYNTKSGIFRQEMASTKNEAAIVYDESTKKLTLRAAYIELEAYNGSTLTAAEIASDISSLQSRASSLESKASSLENSLASLEERIKALGG